MVCKDGQEVREDADDGSSTAEAECVESSLQQTKGASLEDTHDDDRRGCCCWEGIILKRERRVKGDRLLVVVIVEMSRLIIIVISRGEGSS